MAPTVVLILASLLIMGASVAGGLLPAFVRLTHRRLQFGLSFVSGVMLGVALFHMLPHAVLARMESLEGTAEPGHALLDPLMLAVVLGFLAMFVLERFAHVHQHEPPQPTCDDPHHGADDGRAGCGHPHGGPAHGHAHDHGHPRHEAPAVRPTAWVGAAAGMGLHSLLDGVALAASVSAAGAAGGQGGGAVATLAGLGAFLAILLHKPFDAMTIATLLRAGGASRTAIVAFNVAFAALVPVGVIIFLTGVAAAGGASAVVPWALAFSAGTFLCIAAVDLLPEVQFHRHDRLGLSAALVLGLAIAWGVGRLEAATHAHPDHGAAPHAPAAHAPH